MGINNMIKRKIKYKIKSMIKIKSINKIASSLFLIFMCAKIIKIGRNGTSRKKAKGKRQKVKGKGKKAKGKRD
jgi:hypothetical protein